MNILLVYPEHLKSKADEIEQEFLKKRVVCYWGYAKLTESTVTTTWKDMIGDSTMVIILSDHQSHQSEKIMQLLNNAEMLAICFHKNCYWLCGDDERFKFALRCVNWIIEVHQAQQVRRESMENRVNESQAAKNMESLMATVQELNLIVQKLTRQVSVMSCKIHENELEENESVIQVYDIIKQSIHLFNPCHNLQRKIYDADIRNVIDAFAKSMNLIQKRQAVEHNFDFKECSKIIIACLNEHSLKLSSLTSSFLQNLDLLCSVLNQDDLKEKVIAMFLQHPNELIAV